MSFRFVKRFIFVYNVFQNKPKQELNKFITADSSKVADIGVRIHTKTLTMTETFNCQASDLYRALTFKPVRK